MPIQAIFFDVGGVLVRTVDQAPRQRLAARLNSSERELYRQVFDSPTAVRATLGLEPERAVWAYVRQHFQLDDAGLMAFRDDFWAGDRLDQELLDFLGSFRPRYKTAFLSNAWDGARAAFTNQLHMMGAVDDAIISAEVGMAKPMHGIYHLAVERLGVRPNEALLLDDVADNIAAARAVGWQGVQFKTTPQAMREIQEHIAHSRFSPTKHV
jgi:FMN phosphatase YigB (HAD superfamily)